MVRACEIPAGRQKHMVGIGETDSRTKIETRVAVTACLTWRLVKDLRGDSCSPLK